MSSTNKITGLSTGILFFLLGVVFFSAMTSAITASLGNSRAVVHATAGEVIDRFVLVRNVNDVPVDINITVSGDLADKVILKDLTFTLQPGEEKKAYFTIEAEEAGTTETKINVAFISPDGQGVGLAAAIVLVTSDSNGNTGTDSTDQPDDVIDGTDDTNSTGTTNGTGVSVRPGKPTSGSGNKDTPGSGISVSPLMILLILSGLLLVALIVLLVVASKKRKGPKVDTTAGLKKKVRRSNV